MGKIGRNDPCFCGSEKKYKKCCLLKSDQNFALNYSYEVHLQMRRSITRKIREQFEKEYSDGYEPFLIELWDNPFLSEKEIKKLIQHSDASEHFVTMLIDFVLCAVPFEEELYLWEYCLKYHKKIFDKFEVSYLEKWQKDSIYSYFQVKDIYPDKFKVIVEDVFDKKKYTLYDKGLSEQCPLQSIISGMFIPYENDTYVAEACTTTTIDPRFKEKVIDFFKFALKEYNNEVDAKDRVKTIQKLIKRVPVHYYWFDMILWLEYIEPIPKKMVTTDNEEFKFIEAFYSVENKEIVEKQLDKMRNLDKEDSADEGATYHWINERKKHIGGGNTVFGNIKLFEDELILETNSIERLKKWNRKINKIKELSFKNKKVQSIEERMSENKVEGEDQKKEEIPEESLKELAKEFFSNYYKNWIAEKIPALNNISPKEAVKTKKGKEKVKDLINEMEYMNSRHDGPNNIMQYFDADKLRNLLKIKE